LETDARRCALLVGLPGVSVVGVGDWPLWLRIVITVDVERPSCCSRLAHRHGFREVTLVDLPVFGRPTPWCGVNAGAARRVRGRGPSRIRGSRRRAAR
jgi:hypothetical protein